jgi:hypothetical protein
MCGCAKWKECAHPWYVAYKAPKDHATRPGERFRKNLDVIAGFHATNLGEAKIEARRAIVAWLDRRDPAKLQPTDRPTLTQILESYSARPGGHVDAYQIGPIKRTVVQGRAFGEWRAADITREALDAFRTQRPKIAANRDLALLRAMFNWAVADGLLPKTRFVWATWRWCG